MYRVRGESIAKESGQGLGVRGWNGPSCRWEHRRGIVRTPADRARRLGCASRPVRRRLGLNRRNSHTFATKIADSRARNRPAICCPLATQLLREGRELRPPPAKRLAVARHDRIELGERALEVLVDD